jgi:hypothetical protein
MKDFTLYHLFKMQPNALLIQQNFIVCKKRVLQISKDVFVQNNLERIHLYKLDCWMVTVCENRVIFIKLMKRAGSMTYMLHPRSSVLEVLYQYGL